MPPTCAARGELDEGSLDRSGLDEARVSGLRAQLLALAELPPLEREIESGRSRTACR